MDNTEYHQYATRFVVNWLLKNQDKRHFGGNDMWAAGLLAHGNGRRLGKVFKELEDDGMISRLYQPRISVMGHGTTQLVYMRTSWQTPGYNA